VRDLPPWPKIAPIAQRARLAYQQKRDAEAAMATLALPDLTEAEAAQWLRVKSAFASLTSPVIATTYLAAAHPLGLADPNVTIVLPSPALKAGLELGHAATLRAACSKALGRPVEVMLSTAAAHRRAA
jgi:hypothetical protein